MRAKTYSAPLPFSDTHIPNRLGPEEWSRSDSGAIHFRGNRSRNQSINKSKGKKELLVGGGVAGCWPPPVLSRDASVPKCSVVAIEMLRIAVQFLSLDPTNSRLLPQRKPSFYGLGGYKDGFLDSSLSDFHAPT